LHHGVLWTSWACCPGHPIQIILNWYRLYGHIYFYTRTTLARHCWRQTTKHTSNLVGRTGGYTGPAGQSSPHYKLELPAPVYCFRAIEMFSNFTTTLFLSDAGALAMVISVQEWILPWHMDIFHKIISDCSSLKCECTEKHGRTIYPWSHFLEDLAKNLLPEMTDKAWHNTMVTGAERVSLDSSLSKHGSGSQAADYRLTIGLYDLNRENEVVLNFWWEYKVWKKFGDGMAADWSRLARHQQRLYHGVGWSANKSHSHYAWLKSLGSVTTILFGVSKPRLNGLDIRSPQTSQLSSGQ